MDFKELILTELTDKENIVLNEEEILEEGFIFPISPFLAFSAFKKKMFDYLNKEKKLLKIKLQSDGLNKLKEKKEDLQIKGMLAKEKTRAALGIKSGSKETATVYKLTPEQKALMIEIYNKYGSPLIKEINYFRVNVLAPYQLIKRIVKKSKTVTSKDTLGMTKEEFRSALESGRKKILKSGSFFEKSKEVENKIRDLAEEIKILKMEKEKLISGKDLSSSILEKLYAEYKVGEKDFGKYSLVDLKSAYDEYEKNLKLLKSYNKIEKQKATPSEIYELVKRQHEIRKGSDIKLKKKEEEDTKEPKKEKPKEKLETQMSFAAAFGKYMLRRNIRENIKRSNGNEVYVKTYTKIIDEMIKETDEKRKELMTYYVDYKKNIDLNEKEKLIWRKFPGSTTNYTGKLEDYYQAIKEEDFKETQYIERPKELQEAEQEIENEIKRFERKLATIVEPEDLAQLKKYRLINNLITVSELSDPASLFRTQEELRELQNKKIAATHFVDEEEFLAKIKEVTSKQFDDKEELNKAKTELRALAQSLRRQNDQVIINNNAEAFRVALLRKNLEGKPEEQEEEKEEEEEVNFEKVQQIVNLILSREYSSKEEIENDENRMNELIEKFKKQDDDAISKLGSFDEQIKKAKKKLDFAKEVN